ncbi:MAG: HAD-IA family hydrolase [Candidatus Caenarcaniphilales bacterium]|nr:HAD-IA family hydrolase [Candidatus Caenarcaniphilales bacterium]
MDIKLISFDAADTLIKLALSIGDHYSSCAIKYEVVVNPQDVNKTFKKVFANTPPLGTDGKKGFEWWAKVIELTFSDLGFHRSRFSDFDRFAFELYSALAEDRAWILFNDVLPTLKKLKAKDYRMIVFSNFDERLIKILKDLQIFNYFERVVCSTEIGYAKPDKESFLRVSELVDLNPSEILHVGDGVKNDYLGALNADLKAVLLDRNDLFGESETIKSSERILSLEELKERL